MHGRRAEAAELYEIITTRKGSFEALREGLEETRQTGALEVLDDHVKPSALRLVTDTNEFKSILEKLNSVTEIPRAIFWSLYTLSGEIVGMNDPVNNLLELPITFAGNLLTLRDVFPYLSVDDAKELLANEEIKEELFETIDKDCEFIHLDGHLPDLQKLYIPRYISNRILLDSNDFLKNCNDVFVFKGIDRRDLVRLVEPYVTRSSTNQRTKITCRHIFLEQDEDWDYLVLICRSPIHLVCKEDDYFILQNTTSVSGIRSTGTLIKRKHRNAYTSENKFVEQLLQETDQAGALICDVPGMGKTWLMQSIAGKLRSKSNNSVVFFLEVAQLGQALSQHNTSTWDSHQALEYLLDYSCNSKLTAKLLNKHAETNCLKLVFLFDGFDEIHSAYMEATRSFIASIRSYKHVLLIISSRPHMRNVLEHTFNVVSYDIHPFERENQARAVAGHWLKITSDENVQKVTELAIKCVATVQNIQNENTRDILGVPLKCYLLAGVYEAHMIQLCKPNQQNPLQLDEIEPIDSICQLYKGFVEAAVHKVAEAEAHSRNLRVEFERRVLDFHTYMALKLLFPEIANAFKESQQVDLSICAEVARIGVMGSSGHHELEFSHRSFAEYFAGRFFADFWMNVNTFEAKFIQSVVVYFIKSIICADIQKLSNILPRMDLISPTCQGALMSNSNCFVHSTVMWFLNSTYEHESERLNHVSFLTEMANISMCRKNLMLNMYPTILACIEGSFNSILSLLLLLLKSFFSFDVEQKMHELITSSYTGDTAHSKQICGVSLLLRWVAIRGSPEAAKELFQYFEKSFQHYLEEFSENYPQEFFSPVEIAILKNDQDMLLYFVDKVNVPWEWLLGTCLRGCVLSEADIHNRFLITEIIVKSEDNITNPISHDEMRQLLINFGVRNADISIPLLTNYAWKRNFSFKQCTRKQKRIFLRRCLVENNDSEMVMLLLLLFGKADPESIKQPIMLSCLQPSTLMKALDLKEAKKVFSGLLVKDTQNCFRRLHDLKTLAVLLGICRNFQKCNIDEWSYLHIAVQQGKTDWVKHLLRSKLDVNQRDLNGNPPLLSISSKNPVHMISVLINNGADLRAVNIEQQNVAHRLMKEWDSVQVGDIKQFVNLTLQHKYAQMLNISDAYGWTPFGILTSCAGENHPKTKAVKSLLKYQTILGK